MDSHAPNEHHQRLARITGTWSGTEKMHPSPWIPEGAEATSTVTWRSDLSGFVLIGDYRQTMGDTVTYQGHGVYTIDPQSNEVVLHWFDTMGGQREEFRGSWDGDVLTIQSKNAMGHMRLRYDFSEDGRLLNSAEMSPDGENWNRMFDGDLRRE